MRFLAVLAVVLSIPSAAMSADPKPDSFLGRVLAAENAERAWLNLPPLHWDSQLSFDAGVWAQHLAETGKIAHAAGADNPNRDGENLWAGTAGAFTPEQMVGGWMSEKKNFRNGVFPNISKTGKWSDAGHYSQIVWRATTSVGCLKAAGHGMDILVCRFRPAGNLPGQKPY
jgi:hypothetical protein